MATIRWASTCPLTTTALLLLLLASLLDHASITGAQRSLQHWKRDLEHRIRLYEDHHNAIRNVLASSIYAPRETIQLTAPETRISSNGNVRFSDLIIPAGSLRLSPHIVEPTVHILVNKTRAYADSKANELLHIQSQLQTIVRQLDDPRQQYIYKGLRGVPQPQKNLTHVITGTRIFKQVQYAHLIETKNVTVPRINMTDVSRVLDDTYLRNMKVGVYDSQNRLFFEGKKTFWNTVFASSLKSGCCDRLRPLHTNRMMLRSKVQDVVAPLMFQSGGKQLPPGLPVQIDQLATTQLLNRPIELRPPSRPNETGLLLPQAPPANPIRLANLVNINQVNQPEVLKTLVFASPVVVEEGLLSQSYADNRLVIGVADQPNFAFDLMHDNYLLKFSTLPKNYSLPIQQVSGKLIVDAETNFMAGIQASVSVNNVNDFARFISESLVFTNRPARIVGPIQFNALPTMLNSAGMMAAPGLSRQPQNVLILSSSQNLNVGSLNNMRIPHDLVLLPSVNVPRYQPSIRPSDVIRVHGKRNFASQLVCQRDLRVSGLVNGLQLPDEVIPLHLNDFMSSGLAYSNLWFMDGISTYHMTVQGGHFDDINLRDVNGGAQSIILGSMSTNQPDGTTLIRAPMRVMNLHLISGGQQDIGVASTPQPTAGPRRPPTGLLNGFRPQEVIELNPQFMYETIQGHKRFLAPVEASECIFNDINQVANWTNHLIRIDRPNTIQTVHSRLAFTNHASVPRASLQANGSLTSPPATQITIDRLNVEFHKEREPAHYQQNWNFSPEFYLLHQALMRNEANYTGGRYRVLNELKLIHPSGGLVNNIPLHDIVRLDQPFRFADTFTMVGKVEVLNTLSADRIQSNYPIDTMDLVQFDKYRIPLIGRSRTPIKLNSLVLGQGNQAQFVQGRLLNGIALNEFVQSIMSLTRPQIISNPLIFQTPTSFEGWLRTQSAVNGIKQFHQFAQLLKRAKYTFEDGLQCNSVIIRT